MDVCRKGGRDASRRSDTTIGAAAKEAGYGGPAPRSRTGGARGARSFFCESRGSAAVEGAIAISILVAALAGLMAIVQETYSSDRLGRAARAAARAVALDASADPCAAIRLEFRLPERFDCGTRWRISVHQGLHPSVLSSVLADASAEAGGGGEMVMVRIAWGDGAEATEEATAESTSRAGLPAEEEAPAEPEEPRGDARPLATVAVGVARREPDAG